MWQSHHNVVKHVKKKKGGIRLDLCIKLKSGIQEGVDKLY